MCHDRPKCAAGMRRRTWNISQTEPPQPTSSQQPIGGTNTIPPPARTAPPPARAASVHAPFGCAARRTRAADALRCCRRDSNPGADASRAARCASLPAPRPPVRRRHTATVAARRAAPPPARAASVHAPFGRAARRTRGADALRCCRRDGNPGRRCSKSCQVRLPPAPLCAACAPAPLCGAATPQL